MGFIIGHAISIVKEYIAGVTAAVSKATILAMSGLVSWVLDEDEGFGTTYSGDTVGGQRRTIQPGRCYLFDGIDDYVDSVADAPSLNSYTVCLWVKRENNANTEGYVAYGNRASALEGWSILKTSSNVLVCRCSDGTDRASQSIDITPYFLADTWYHVALVINRSDNTIKGYINGSNANWVAGGGGPTTDSLASIDSIHLGSTKIEVGRLGTSGYTDACIRELKIYDRVLTGAELTSLSNLESISLTDILLWYKMEEGAGTITYDSSGNGNDGTITNATLSTFHATDTGVNYSYANEVGYNLSGTTIIPRDESDTANDVLGNPLTYSDRVKYDFNLAKSNCLTFDGVNDYIGDLGAVSDFSFIQNTLVFEVELYVSFASTTTRQLFMGNTLTASEKGFFIGLENGVGQGTKAIRFSAYTGGAFLINVRTDDNIITDSDWHKVKISGDGSAVSFYIDDALVTTNVINSLGTLATGDSSRTLSVGRVSSGSTSLTFNGSMCGVTLTDGTDTKLYLPLAEGSQSTAYDISGNNNHGTLTNFTLADAWGTKQDVYHYNILNGFTSALTFDGVDDYVLSNTSVSMTSSFSISYWINADITNFGTTKGIFTNRVNSSNGFAVISTSGGYMWHTFIVGGTTVGGRFQATSIHDNTWVHVVAVLSGGVVTLYVDGTTIAMTTNSSGLHTVDNTITVGRRTSNYFPGSMADCRAYSKALSADEVTYIYTHGVSGIDPTTTNLELKYLLNEGINTTVVDDSGNSHTGTLTDFTLADAWALKLPALSAGANDAAIGTALSNPAGYWHNNAETVLQAPNAPAMHVANDAEGNEFLFDASDVAQDITYDLIDDDINNTQYFFADISETNQKRNLLIFDEEKTGSDLADIQTYLNH